MGSTIDALKKSMKYTVTLLSLLFVLFLGFVFIVVSVDPQDFNESESTEHYWETFDFKIEKELDSVASISSVDYNNETKSIFVHFGGYTTSSKLRDVCGIMEVLNKHPDEINDITLVNTQMLYGLDGNGVNTLVIELQTTTNTSKNVDFEEVSYFDDERLLQAMYYNFEYCYIHPALLEDYGE